MMLFNVLALTALTATTLTFAPKASANDYAAFMQTLMGRLNEITTEHVGADFHTLGTA